MADLSLTLLGRFECRDASGRRIALPTRKAEAILAYVAMSPGMAQPREKLAALLWDEKADSQARANLRKALSRIRQSLPGAAADCLSATMSRVALNRERTAVDVARFEELAAAATPDCLEGAAALYREAFLDGVADCGEAFDDWVAMERRRLEELARTVLERLLEHYIITGAIDRGIQVALRLLALDPLDEGVHRALVRLYLYQDRIGAAHQQYVSCKALLAQDLGVDPAPETDMLHAEVRRQLPGGRGSEPERETDTLPEREGVVTAAAKNRARRRIEIRGRPSIAVLAFKTSDDGGAEAYLGEGLAEVSSPSSGALASSTSSPRRPRSPIAAPLFRQPVSGLRSARDMSSKAVSGRRAGGCESRPV